MFPAATLFLDVCVQRAFWSAGDWPLVGDETGRTLAQLLDVAARTDVRRGGIVCRHDLHGGMPAARGSPIHCSTVESQREPEGCVPPDPSAVYVESGCGQRPDDPAYGDRFRRLTAGVRDAVVFGAGLEYGVARAVDALLLRRIRTHLVIDAVAAEDEVAAQLVVASWKRRGVDVVTAAVVERLLLLR